MPQQDVLAGYLAKFFHNAFGKVDSPGLQAHDDRVREILVIFNQLLTKPADHYFQKGAAEY
ncbi:hypothetical protein GCM10010967_39840 [Dyadobacter beijingensis]|uniref:Uncharacterized protein n=1 Tax=Dyadobacter beijingensis TaxID=365489 RepID=A0ABQ2I810_9BACT|nr:hypothetical protein GCM10010967_39840 [Dyadobacter beijingensis]